MDEVVSREPRGGGVIWWLFFLSLGLFVVVCGLWYAAKREAEIDRMLDDPLAPVHSRPPEGQTMTFEEEVSAAVQAARLTSAGYRRVSNKHRIVSRIDREDWLEHLARKMRQAPADFILKDGTGRVSPAWCDHYRRIYSKDTITVSSEAVFRLIPGSGFDPVGFIPR
jgi:hypothetical protein